jgi:hypothetical protein
MVLAVLVVDEADNAKPAIDGREIRDGHDFHARFALAGSAVKLQRTLSEGLNILCDNFFYSRDFHDVSLAILGFSFPVLYPLKPT